MANKFTDVQRDLIEDLYLAGADENYIILEEKGKVYNNKIATLVQKGILHVDVNKEAKVTYKLTAAGVIEAHKSFNTSK